MYRVFNDRGSVEQVLERSFPVDASSIVLGGTLPVLEGFDGGRYRIEYYDGELLRLSEGGRTMELRYGGGQAELFEARCPENIHVKESVSMRISLEAPARVEHPDFGRMFVDGSYNALVLNALPVAGTDPDAARCLIWAFTEYANHFLVDGAALSEIGRLALEGDRYALLLKGCREFYTRPCEDSWDVALDCFSRACGAGLEEARVFLALMSRRGKDGDADLPRARALLAEALEAGCGFAVKVSLADRIYGRAGTEANPAVVAEEVSRLEESEPMNPWWPYLKACALQKTGGMAASAGAYRRAAELGMRIAWSDLAVVGTHDDNFKVIDRTAYVRALEEGVRHRDYFSKYLLAVSAVEDIETRSAYAQYVAACQLQADLETAYSWGSSEAAEMLGDISLEGEYGTVTDISGAWKWYCRGAALGNGSCYSKMYGMVLDGHVDKDRDFLEMCARRGALDL